ncbi:MAG: DUF523 domain-containing protein [Clostridia bacterium]
MIFVSACLLGENCKYSGGNNRNEAVISFLNDKEYLAVCPERAGGLPAPRPPAEIRDGRVIDKEGKDVTAEFLLGAEKTLALAKKHRPELCILKANSPSCGCGEIYDGTFSGRKISGNGKTVELFLKNGFSVITEKQIKKD